MDFENFVYTLSNEQISDLADRQFEANNVLSGIKPDCYFTIMNLDDLVFQFTYINCQNEYRGYLLQLKFKQENFYCHIISFAFYLSLEFKLVNPVQVYNSFLYQLRSGLETKPIHTVSTRELKKLQDVFNDPEPVLFSPFGIEVIPFLEKREFYQELLGVEKIHKIEVGKKYVYLILNSRNGYFKIGRSKNPLKREKTLQSEDPEILLIKYWEADNKFEKYLHNNFKRQRVRGEWFRLTIDDLFKIKQLTIDSVF